MIAMDGKEVSALILNTYIRRIVVKELLKSNSFIYCYYIVFFNRKI